MGDYLAGPQDIHMMRDINNTLDVLTKGIPKSRKLGFKVTFMTICVLLGLVEVYDSLRRKFVIQACDGQTYFDGRAMGEDGTALPWQGQ